jgi:hypothetical protein
VKLNPPASSSDLEVARTIAQRLHQRRRGTDVAPLSAPEPPAPATHALGRASVEVPAPVWSVEAPPPTPPDLSAFRERAAPPSDAGRTAAPWNESAPPEPIDPLAGLAESPEPASAVSAVSPEDLLVGQDGPPAAGPDEEVIQVPDVPEPSVFDEALDAPQDEADDIFAPPPPPSWDDVAESCLSLSHARGAMLIDPAGQVVAARGEWPEPGPDLIAGKLVAMMARTLRDAPTRSVSAPLAGLHLTAWRVPLPEGLVTAAFIANAPVRSDTRPAIDTEIHRGAGA